MHLYFLPFVQLFNYTKSSLIKGSQFGNKTGLAWVKKDLGVGWNCGLLKWRTGGNSTTLVAAVN